MRPQLVVPGESALAQGVGFQREQRPRSSPATFPAGLPHMPFAAGADSVEMLLRQLEGKDASEMLGCVERALPGP